MKKVLWTMILMSAFSQSEGRNQIDGNDFFNGSASLNLIESLAKEHDVTGQDMIFNFSTRYSAVDLKVRAVDINGLPLLGGAASGLISGSIMKYGFNAIFPFFVGKNDILTSCSGVFMLDHFAASHVNGFWDLSNPYEGAFFSGFFSGGKSGGFGAVAGQLLLGADFYLFDFIGAGAYLFLKYPQKTRPPARLPVRTRRQVHAGRYNFLLKIYYVRVTHNFLLKICSTPTRLASLRLSIASLIAIKRQAPQCF